MHCSRYNKYQETESRPVPAPAPPPCRRLEEIRALLPRERLQEMIRAYNQVRGWSPEGFIPTERIRTLDLLDLVS